MRLDTDDPLSELLDLDQAAQVAGVTRRTVNRWIADGRLRRLGRYVVERELLAVEAERHQARRAGCPGPRLSA